MPIDLLQADEGAGDSAQLGGTQLSQRYMNYKNITVAGTGVLGGYSDQSPIGF